MDNYTNKIKELIEKYEDSREELDEGIIDSVTGALKRPGSGFYNRVLKFWGGNYNPSKLIYLRTDRDFFKTFSPIKQELEEGEKIQKALEIAIKRCEELAAQYNANIQDPEAEQSADVDVEDDDEVEQPNNTSPSSTDSERFSPTPLVSQTLYDIQASEIINEYKVVSGHKQEAIIFVERYLYILKKLEEKDIFKYCTYILTPPAQSELGRAAVSSLRCLIQKWPGDVPSNLAVSPDGSDIVRLDRNSLEVLFEWRDIEGGLTAEQQKEKYVELLFTSAEARKKAMAKKPIHNVPGVDALSFIIGNVIDYNKSVIMIAPESPVDLNQFLGRKFNEMQSELLAVAKRYKVDLTPIETGTKTLDIGRSTIRYNPFNAEGIVEPHMMGVFFEEFAKVLTELADRGNNGIYIKNLVESFLMASDPEATKIRKTTAREPSKGTHTIGAKSTAKPSRVVLTARATTYDILKKHMGDVLLYMTPKEKERHDMSTMEKAAKGYGKFKNIVDTLYSIGR